MYTQYLCLIEPRLNEILSSDDDVISDEVCDIYMYMCIILYRVIIQGDLPDKIDHEVSTHYMYKQFMFCIIDNTSIYMYMCTIGGNHK